MKKHTKKLFEKALLMAVLTGAIIGVSHAGYDATDDAAENSVTVNEGVTMRGAHAGVLTQTLSEEFTEIEALASQQAKFRAMDNRESTQIARMYGRWIRQHKAGVPMLAALIRAHGGNPEDAKELKAPVLGTKMEMLHATHMDHMAAVMSSQLRFKIAKADGDEPVMMFLNKRATMARKHMAEMGKYHNSRNCPMCKNMSM